MDNKKNKLRSCAPIYTQHATNRTNKATISATDNATVDLKALALTGLERNKERNQTAIKEKKQRNSDAPKVAQKLRLKKCMECEHAEHFKRIGTGCEHIIEGYYQRQWTLLDKLVVCPRGYWN